MSYAMKSTDICVSTDVIACRLWGIMHLPLLEEAPNWLESTVEYYLDNPSRLYMAAHAESLHEVYAHAQTAVR
jgi:hypothetical protein